MGRISTSRVTRFERESLQYRVILTPSEDTAEAKIGMNLTNSWFC